MKKIIILLALIISNSIGFSLISFLDFNKDVHRPISTKVIAALKREHNWAEIQMKKMSLEEKIAQLMMIRIHSNYGQEYQDNMVALIQKYQPGGVCFFQGGPYRQISLTNRIQKVCNVPLLVSIDGEWGPAMRLDSCISFPRQMTLGALDEQNTYLIYDMAKEIAQQCKTLGVNINFAPVVDVNNNPNNPVINSRSFGETREPVADRAILYMKGLQENGISGCAKHFPGHGDTGTDSHASLPVIRKSREELENMEFYPFRKIINEGIDMVMISHLNIPSLDSERNSISTLSFQTITMTLKKDMAFDGIVITDAMDMGGLRNSYNGGGEAEIRALLAGIDILLLPNDLSVVIPAIKKAVENGRIPEELIDEKCLKILKFKESKGLTNFTEIPTEDLFMKMNTDNAKNIIGQIEAKALTLLKNENDILPLDDADSVHIALLCIGGISDSSQLKEMCKKRGIGFVQTDRSIKNGTTSSLMKQLEPYSKVIVAMLSTNQLPGYNYGIYNESVNFINDIDDNKEIILSIFGNPYSLARFGSLSKYKSIIIGYQPTPTAVNSALNAIFGDASFGGHLPVSVKSYRAGDGINMLNVMLETPSGNFSVLPEKTNRQIDSIVQKGINEQVFPGCQIIAVKDNKTVFSKSYGFQTYEQKSPIDADVLYDIASVTKSAATTLAVMKLYDEGKIKLDDKIGKYLPYLKGSNKVNLTLVELLTHTSGLPAFIPFYKSIAPDGKWDNDVLSKVKTPLFNIEIAENVYLHESYPDEVREKIAACKLGSKEYEYSDLGFVLLKDMVEKITGMPLDQYLNEQFYKPMGLKNTCFNPLRHTIPAARIAPTENDKEFRKQVLKGYVHDQTAALFGGVSGNAGLFSNAHDLAVIFQMLMDKGVYNGKQYFSKETVSLFTSTYILHGCKRRALGFDTPSYDKKSPVLPSAAGMKTFGHQGFTGTVVWCDPDSRLIYIFLSNRVYPNAEPNKLAKSKIRLTVHDAIYKGLPK